MLNCKKKRKERKKERTRNINFLNIKIGNFFTFGIKINNLDYIKLIHHCNKLE